MLNRRQKLSSDETKTILITQKKTATEVAVFLEITLS